MANSNSERGKRKREVFLVGMGVAVGILGQSIYDILKGIFSNNPSSEYVDFFAGATAAFSLVVILRLTLGSDWRGLPPKSNTEKKAAEPPKT